MKKKLFMFISAFWLFCFIASCAATPVKGIHMSRRSDVDAGVYSVTVDAFGPGEIPTVVVTGCGERNVTIELIDLATGKIIATRKDYVPRDWVRWWYFPDLPQGSYHVILRISDNIIGTSSFMVTK